MRVLVAMESTKTAEKAMGRKFYLARLVAGQTGIDREFAAKRKELNERNRRAFAMEARPGDVFEARRGWWDGAQHVGGTCWFGVDHDGSAVELSRDEAFANVALPYIPPRIDSETPAPARRMPPAHIYARIIDGGRDVPAIEA